MAGGRIAGITIEIGGDTQKLNKALSGVNKDLNSTSKELRDVNRLLKLDPKNTTLLAQKQKLLADQIGKTKDKLATLKDAEEQARQALEKGEIGQKEFDGLQREIVDTENKLKSLEKEAENMPNAFTKIADAGEKLKGMGESVEGVGKKFLPVTAAVTGIGTASVKVAADFEKSMDNVQSISGATGEDIDALAEKAREMGAKSKFSAQEAADGLSYMAMAGWSTKDMLDGIEGVMTLAAASGEDLAHTSDIVTDSLTAFGMAATESGHFADILAAASNNANTNVSMLGESFKYVAPLAGAMKYSAEDTSIALGLMANSGIKASSAGTALRTILTNMAKPTDAMSIAMEDLGLSLENSDGSMKSLMDIMKDMREGFANVGISVDEFKEQQAMLDQELAAGNITQKQYSQFLEDSAKKAFTNADALRAQEAATLAGKTGLSGLLAIVSASDEDFNGLTDAIYNCNGAAQEMADVQMDNLDGKLTTVKSKLSEVGIQLGEILMPYIEDAVDAIGKLVDWFSNLDDGTKKTIITIALVAAAIGPLLIGIGKTMIFVGQLMTFMPQIKTAVTAVTGAVGGLSSGFLIAAGVIAAIIAVGVLLYKNWDTIKAKAKELFNKIKETFDGIKNKISDAWDGAKRKTIDVIREMLMKIKEFLRDTKEKFSKIKEDMSKPFEQAKDKIKEAIDKIKDKIDGFKSKLKDLATFKWLKIPHISISGGKVPFGIGGKGEKPSFSIEWHAKAMEQPFMLDKATIFGMAGGNLLGGGEKGREMIYGHDSLMTDISNASGGKFMPQIFTAISNLLSITSRYLPSISDGVNGSSGMDKRDIIRFIRGVT